MNIRNEGCGRPSTGSRQLARNPPARRAADRINNGVLAQAIGAILVSAATAHAQQAPDATSASDTSHLSEIVVTAQRRSQRAEDIPYNLTAIDANAVQNTGANTLNDLTRVVPGLTTVDTGPAERGGVNNFTMRGLRADAPGGSGLGPDQQNLTVSPVSTYYGETPVFFAFPLRDIDHIEVLRGPQGTLYGSGAEAGTIRFVPRRPDFAGFSGNVNASGSATENSDGHLNSDVDAVINVPVADRLALRIGAGREHLGGFINEVDLKAREGSGTLATPTPSIPGDLLSGPVLAPIQKAANSSDVWYGHAAVRWQPVDMWDLQIDYLHQDTRVADVQSSNPNWPGGLDPYISPTFNTRPGGRYDNTAAILQPFANKVDLASNVATADFGLATFTSATSYFHSTLAAVNDNSGGYNDPAFTNFLPYYANYPRIIPIVQPSNDTRVFVQELRAVSHWTKPIDYVVGAYFQHQQNSDHLPAALPGISDYGAAVGLAPQIPGYGDYAGLQNRHQTFEDRAIFGELTWHITPAWQATGGLRLFRQTFHVQSTTLFPFPGVGANANNSTESSKPLYKLNTSYDVSTTTKIYATFAEGFRRGGANPITTVGVFASSPAYETYKPDLAKNYELGIKGSLDERKFRYTADLFWIDLSDFQFNGTTLTGLPAAFNTAKARSRGAEIETEMLLTQRLRATLGYTYTQATIRQSQTFYDLGFCGQPQCVLYDMQAGSRLPGVPKQTLTVAADYKVSLPAMGHADAFVNFHADSAYHGSSPGTVNHAATLSDGTPNKQALLFWEVPASVVTNARITLDGGSGWSAELFINNVTSATAYSGASLTQELPTVYSTRNVTRPRTVGMELRYRF